MKLIIRVRPANTICLDAILEIIVEFYSEVRVRLYLKQSIFENLEKLQLDHW